VSLPASLGSLRGLTGYLLSMGRRKVEIEIDEELVNEVIRRYHVHGTREAVHLALRTLVAESKAEDSSLDDEGQDPFGLDALRPPVSRDKG
jgi:Arc/MetJ family transcription regulator